MVITLADIRRQRDADERTELLARYEQIRRKLVPLMVLDMQGELDHETGLTLLELCDDLEVSEAQYEAMKAAAKAAATDHHHCQQVLPKIEAEKLRNAKFTLARRRAEQSAQAALKAIRLQSRFINTRNGYMRSLEERSVAFPFLFEPSGELLQSITELPQATSDKPTPPMSHCAICLVEFANPTGQQYCSARCDHIATEHRDALIQLKVLKPAKKVSRSHDDS